MGNVEIPILVVNIFYYFLFYSMASGDLRLMVSNLLSFNNGIIGLTFAISGFGLSVAFNRFQIASISINNNSLVVKNRLGLSKRYPLTGLEKCLIKWYDGRGRRYPFIQLNFQDKKKLQIAGHQYRNLKPFILFLRSEIREKLQETK